MRALAVLSFLSVLSFGVASTASAATHDHVSWEPSGCGPGRAARYEASNELPLRRLKGFVRIYCNDFRGTALSSGWDKFSGQPGGDPTGMFEPSHVVLATGMLRIRTYRDPSIGDRWATGGVCQCGLAQTYGAYFVRSRVTAPGDDNVELLWPSAPIWPPEIDFNETGRSAARTGWYLHFDANNNQVENQLRINLTQWHTWGVIWRSNSVIFTVDGEVWGVVKNRAEIPHTAMTLDMQEQTFCGIAPECPSKPLSMLVDWVAVFAPSHS